ncbi:MAG: efflux RND transporter periplasmic adaptor subunit [Victivallaceae bacterium]|nr:efflux RND transporter periplasmic adaptor subunit [Victivallaceae bacterium]
MKINKTALFIGFVILVLGGFVVWRVIYREKKSEGSVGGASVVAVEVAKVEVRAIFDLRRFTGTVFSDAEFTVAPRVSGWARKINFNVGDVVNNEDIVAVLDDEEYRLNKEQAEAELEVARANLAEYESMLNVKERDYRRAAGLHSNRIVSDAELDRVTAEYRSYEAKKKVAEAQVKLRQAMLASAKVQQSYATVKATWAGGSPRRYVGERFINEGSLLQANAPLMTLIDLDTMKIVINVIERDLPFIKVGQDAKIFVDAFKDRPFIAKVIRVSPIVKEKSRQGAVELSIDNHSHELKPGMFAVAEIEFGASQNARVAPVTALARRNDVEGMFVTTSDSKVKFVPVTTGISTKSLVEIISPKDFYGTVVVMGHHLLEDGSAIMIAGKGVQQTAAENR